MNFKKLEIYGFKSFADKLEVKFDNGITGIVGPNGCGKSNVADAIRWVMGEQSAKSLRGSSMQDVIFNGTEARKPQNFSEVSLYFDNSKKIFPVDYDEVVLTRKLYRSGESEYTINKNPCRLKDIVDILHDSGLGRESYCVIGQGKIDSLLSAKPEERRSVFEEAAGIAKFKTRKKEAERKLDTTRDNLTRLSDIISELESRLGPLTKQSENANKFLELRERLKTLELNIYVHQYDYSAVNKQAIRQKLDAIEEELALKTADFEKAVENFNNSSEKIQELDKNIENLRDELLELTVGLEKQSGETKLIQEKMANLNNLKEKLETDIKQDEILGENLAKALDDKKKELANQEVILSELVKQSEKINDEYLEVADRLLVGEKEAEAHEGELFDTLEKIGDVKSNLSSIKAEKQMLEEKKLEVINKQSEIELSLKNLSDELTESQNAFENIISQADKLAAKREELVNMADSLVDKENDIAKELDDLKVEYHTKLSRVHVLQEMQEDNEGFVVPVKRLFEQAKSNTKLSKMIVGVVAKLMRVPERLETAIEMALGVSVQNIVTNTEDDAKFIVNYLKENRFGRATFLPADTVKERSVSDFVRSKLNMKGVLGVASDLIEFDQSLEPVFKHLLGATVIVDTLDNATLLARSTSYSTKIVTLDGDIINPLGAITGGSKKESTSNLIGRAREIEDLNKSIQVIKNDVKNLLERQQKIKDQAEKNNQELLNINEEIHNNELQSAKQTENNYRIEDLISSTEREKRSLEFSLQTIFDKLEYLEDALTKVENQEKQMTDKKEEASETKRKETSRFDVLRKQRESLYDSLTEIKVKIASGNSSVFALKNEIERLETNIAESNYRLRENKLEYQKTLTDIAELQGMLDEMMKESAYKGNMDKLQAVRDKLAGLDTYKAQLQAEVGKADQEKMALSAEIQRVSEKKTKEEMNLAKVDTDIEAMQERVWEEYNMTYASAVEFKLTDFDLSEGLSESAKIKKQISALGYVNVAAIEELKEVTARYTDLTTQRDDLKKAEDDLLKIIKELTTEMEGRFKDA
ncbi:MAG: chromosome segregation protein SMC, partial [Clostridia bacterium]|nr:chromosome segregation protein SMC [Clostridia bacterium]